MTLTPPIAKPAARITRGIPRDLDGTLCVCDHGRRPERAHAPTYLMERGSEREVGCVGAAAAFAAQHQLPFPLTSASAPEAP